jgi:hypothetical protein
MPAKYRASLSDDTEPALTFVISAIGPKMPRIQITLHMPKIRFLSSISVLAIALVGLVSCDPDPIKVVPEANYFPLRVGDYHIYHVQETQVSAYNVETQFDYDIKTVVIDSFANVSGNYSYLISRFKRADDTEAWTSIDTWTARADEREVVVTEGSTPFVRLTFPVKSGRSWNGNSYNDLETSEFCVGDSFTSCDLYEIGNVEKPFSTSVNSYENTLEVIQNNSPDLITKYDVRKEVFAASIGLIYKESTILNYCTVGACLGQQLAESGVKLKQELIEYGHD